MSWALVRRVGWLLRILCLTSWLLSSRSSMTTRTCLFPVIQRRGVRCIIYLLPYCPQYIYSIKGHWCFCHDVGQCHCNEHFCICGLWSQWRAVGPCGQDQWVHFLAMWLLWQSETGWLKTFCLRGKRNQVVEVMLSVPTNKCYIYIYSPCFLIFFYLLIFSILFQPHLVHMNSNVNCASFLWACLITGDKFNVCWYSHLWSPPEKHVAGWHCKNRFGRQLSPHNRTCLHKDLHGGITRYYFYTICRLKNIENNFWD